MVPLSGARRFMISARLLIVEFTFSSIFCAFRLKNIQKVEWMYLYDYPVYDDFMYLMCSDGE